VVGSAIVLTRWVLPREHRSVRRANRLIRQPLASQTSSLGCQSSEAPGFGHVGPGLAGSSSAAGVSAAAGATGGGISAGADGEPKSLAKVV
jgi:hypothetical protein